MTKIAYGAQSIDDLRSWFADGDGDEVLLTTRYLPKRHEEMAGGSLYWIFEHAIVARAAIKGFAQREDGRWWIILDRKLVDVEPRARRAHQGWRYLKEEDAPRDLDHGEIGGDVMPGHLVKELAKLGLV